MIQKQMLIIILLVFSACASPPKVGKIQDRAEQNSTGNITIQMPSQNISSDVVVNKTNTDVDDALDKEIKQLLEESKKMGEKIEPVVQKDSDNDSDIKKKVVRSSDGLSTVKGTIELGTSVQKDSGVQKTQSGDIVIESSKGFKGANYYPKGTINLNLVNETQEQAKQIYRSTFKSPSPYEALLNITRQNDAQVRR